MHGHEQEVTLGARTVLLYPLYHPAAALYTPSMLKVLEEDFARIPALLDARRSTRLPPSSEAATRRSSSPSPSRPARPVLTCSIELASASAGETERSRPRLAERLRPGDVVTVSGELGREDDFVRGACRALGVDRAGDEPDVHDRPPLRGGSTSRISTSTASAASPPAEWGDLEPYFDDAVVFVEWPEAGLDALPARALAVRLEHAGGDQRRIVLAADESALLEGIA